MTHLKVARFVTARPGQDPNSAKDAWLAVGDSGAVNYPGLARAERSVALDADESPYGASPYLGVEELWFDTLTHALPALGVDDESTHPGTAPFLYTSLPTEEHVILDGYPIEPTLPAVRVVMSWNRRAELTMWDAHQYWTHTHTPLVKPPGLTRYVQSYTISDPALPTPPVFDGVVELWHRDIDSLQASASYDRGKRDFPNFGAGSQSLVATRRDILTS